MFSVPVPRPTLRPARRAALRAALWAVRPRGWDGPIALAVTVVVVCLVSRVRWWESGFDRPDALTIALAFVGGAAAGWRRVVPLTTVVVCTAAIVLITARGNDVTDALPTVLCVLLLSLAHRRDLAAAAAGLGVVALGYVIVILYHPPGLDRANVGSTSTIIVASWLIGRLLRSRQTVLVTRAETAEQRAAAEADRAALLVSAERLSIARELHDILSHTVSVITVQATVGEHLADRDPAAARRSLQVIGTTSRGALDELRRLLAVLREDGAPDRDGVTRSPLDSPVRPGATPAAGRAGAGRAAPSADRSAAVLSAAGDDGIAPVHRLDDLDGLLGRLREAGLAVRLRTEGVVRELPPAAEASGYRIVQEALTNVIRHAPGASAEVVLAYEPAALVLTITNDGDPPAAGAPPRQPTRAGHGLVGMRERTALFRGTVTAAPRPEGGFRVRAVLPHPDAENAGGAA